MIAGDAVRTRSPERGAVLLAVMLMLSMLAAVSAAMLERAGSAVAEMRARRDVLCARYAALGGLALGGPVANAQGLVGPGVDSLSVARVLLSPSWCVLRASARCGTAVRTLDRTVEPSACGT